jgi:hypothetical protein
MDATLTERMLPDRDILVREVCSALGDGGTMDHARAAVDWAYRRFGSLMETESARVRSAQVEGVSPALIERTLADLVSVKEAAGIVGTTRANIMRWSNRHGRTDFPAPVLVLDCGPHWSRATLRRWTADVFPTDQAQEPNKSGKI